MPRPKIHFLRPQISCVDEVYFPRTTIQKWGGGEISKNSKYHTWYSVWGTSPIFGTISGTRYSYNRTQFRCIYRNYEEVIALFGPQNWSFPHFGLMVLKKRHMSYYTIWIFLDNLLLASGRYLLSSRRRWSYRIKYLAVGWGVCPTLLRSSGSLSGIEPLIRSYPCLVLTVGMMIFNYAHRVPRPKDMKIHVL